MSTKCVNCGFYITNFEKVCPNCGLRNPTNTFRRTTLKFLLTSLSFSFLFSAIITLFAVIFLRGQSVPSIFLVTFVVLSFIIYVFIKEKYTIKPQFYKSPFLSELDKKEKIINGRAVELAERGKKIDAVLDKIKDTDSNQLQDVRAKLLSAREIVISQFARYELQKQKIELVRLQNGVSRYLAGLHRLNDLETENGLLAIETARREIERIGQNLTRYDAIEFSERVLPEKENFLSQLSETVDSCDRLREAILSRQAVKALQGISPIEENLKLPASKDLAHAAETFNIETTLTDFSESFEELEREYKRLRAESDQSRDILER